MQFKKFKKLTAVILSVMLVLGMCATGLSVSAAGAGDTYVVAGFPELCGSTWSGADANNQMTDNGDGTYTIAYDNVAPMNGYQFKVVKNNSEWFGTSDGNNVTFNVITNCDVTITFNAESKEITVSGDYVRMPTDLEIEKICAVGNGSGAWLADVSWDPGAQDNVMIEVAPMIYESLYEGVPAGDGYLVKFTANGSWADNWGGTFSESDVETTAYYNGDDISFSVPYDRASVKLRLDLSNFDYATKKGALFTITIRDMNETAPATSTTATEPVETTEPETSAPETEPVETTEPETSAPETEPVETTEPETTAPETEPVETTEPETSAPETEPVETTEPVTTAPETSAPVSYPIYVVAGVTELCGTTWEGDYKLSLDNIMSANDDGTFTKVYKNVAVMDSYQLKIVENLSDGTQKWHGVDGGLDNLVFNVVKECDVTVTFNPATKSMKVSGDGVEIPTGFEIESMRVVGNGDGAWLNGIDWDPAADQNYMREVADGVYEISFRNLLKWDSYEFKFAANGSWAFNWGGTYAGSGVKAEAVFNARNDIIFDVPYELADVKIKLDLSKFDYASKTGATFTITVFPVTTSSTIRIAAPTSGNSAFNWSDVQFYYGNTTTMDEMNCINMKATGEKYYPSTTGSNVLINQNAWTIYEAEITAMQAYEINSAKFAGFKKTYSDSARTLVTTNIFKAGTNEYTDYASKAAPVEDFDGKTFIIFDSIYGAKSGISYVGYWATADMLSKPVTIYFAAPKGAKSYQTWNGVTLIYGDTADRTQMSKLELTKTDKKYTVDSTSLKTVSAGEWDVYSLTLTESQIESINESRYVGFMKTGSYYRTYLTMPYNVLKAGFTAEYSANAKSINSFDGCTFVIQDAANSANELSTYIGSWVTAE